MIKIIDNIEIEYEEEAENFINELIEYLKENRNSVYEFLNFIPRDTIKIKIVSTQSELRRIYNDNVSLENMPNWVVGFSTLDKTINLLSFNQYKNTPHYSSTLEDYKKTLVHEFVHAVHDIFSGGNYTGPKPIWEGVAVYLSGQHNGNGTLTVTKDELMTEYQDMSEYAIFLKKLLEIYDHDTVLKILNSKIDGNIIIDEVFTAVKSVK